LTPTPVRCGTCQAITQPVHSIRDYTRQNHFVHSLAIELRLPTQFSSDQDSTASE
jgi:hypothetical protein